MYKDILYNQLSNCHTQLWGRLPTTEHECRALFWLITDISC